MVHRRAKMCGATDTWHSLCHFLHAFSMLRYGYGYGGGRVEKQNRQASNLVHTYPWAWAWEEVESAHHNTMGCNHTA